MLEAVNLECVRGERRLFGDLDMSVRGGELLRIAGANGSGKTSLLRLLCGLLAPSHGEVRWRGKSITELREEFWKELLYIGHASAVKDDLTAEENLAVACTLAGIAATKDSVREALRQLGLAGCEHLPARVLSQGQRRRVALARLALGESVTLWILDEPFTALDAAAVIHVQALIAQQVARGASVVYTTHYEVEIAASVSLRIDLDARMN